MNVEVYAVDGEREIVRIACCDRLLSVQWVGPAPGVGPAAVEVDVPDTTWSVLLGDDDGDDGIPAIVSAYDADGTTHLSLLDGSPLMIVTGDEPPLGVIGRRVSVPVAGWTVYPVTY